MSNASVEGNTSLHSSIIKSDDLNIITMLLDNGANIHAKNRDNYEPLHIAIQHDKTEAALLLIRRGALIEENLNLLLQMAIEQENFTIVKMLIDHGMQYKLSIDLETFNATIFRRNPEMLEYIISHCQFLKPSDRYIPREFVTNDITKKKPQYEECVKILLKWNFTVNPNSRHDEEFIYAAVEHNYVQIVLQLLKLGINVNIVNPISKLNLLATACFKKQYQIVENLLQHNADVNMVMSVGIRKTCYLKNTTCLHVALYTSDPVMTKILLRYGAKMMNGPAFRNIISIAVQNDSEEIIRILLDYGVDVKYNHFQQETPLHFCVNFGKGKDSRYNIVKLLLENGANIHLQAPGNALLFDAINNGHRKIAQLFLDYNSDVKYCSPDGDTPLHKAIENNFDVEFIKTLLKFSPPIDAVNNKGLTPLLVACKNQPFSRLEIIETLLHYNANVHYTDDKLMTPLYLACEAQHLKLIKILLKNGANVNATTIYGHTPLHCSCRYRNEMTLKIIQLLLEHGANIEATNAKGSTPLFEACCSGNDIAVKYLLEYHANLNAKNFEGMTLLHIACNSNIDMASHMIELLLELSANIEATDAKGSTPLFEACYSGNAMAVKCLLENHANPHAKNFQGLTPLHIVCKYVRETTPKIIQLLLQNNVNIEAVNAKGQAPLFIACDNKNEEAVRYLLNHGANPNSVDLEYSTLLHIAIKQKSIRIVKDLIKYGANINILDGENRTPLQNAVKNILLSYKLYSDDANSDRWNYEKIIKILLSQGIKLKVAGLMIKNDNNSNLAYNSDPYITIDNVQYSSIGILEFNIVSKVNNDIFNNIRFSDEEDSIGDIRKLEVNCNQEIEKMKIESIGINDMRFSDLLKPNIHLRSTLMENKKIQKTLKQNIYDEKFPLYINIVRNRLKVAKIQYSMKKSAKKCIRLHIYQRLPDECIDLILDYLSIKELETFVKNVNLF